MEVKMTIQNQPDFHLQVEDFVLNASNNSLGENTPKENEIRLFLLTFVILSYSSHNTSRIQPLLE